MPAAAVVMVAACKVTNGHGGIRLRSELSLTINLNRKRELRSLIPHIADALIDRPNLQVGIRAWLEHRQQFIIGRRLFSKPPRPILLRQDDRHPIVEFAHHAV
jgi:hypothetical protein